MTKIAENVLVKTPVFDVVEKTFKETDFKPVGLNAKNWVLVVVKDENKGEATERDIPHLLVKQTRWGSEEQTIEFPCGTVEESDYENKEALEYVKIRYLTENPSRELVGAFSAAIREVKEETGIDISNVEDFCWITKMASFNPNPAYFNNTMTILRVRAKKPLKEIFEKRGEQHLDKDEDCKAFVSKPYDYHNEIEKSAMGLIAIDIE